MTISGLFYVTKTNFFSEIVHKIVAETRLDVRNDITLNNRNENPPVGKTSLFSLSSMLRIWNWIVLILLDWLYGFRGPRPTELVMWQYRRTTLLAQRYSLNLDFGFVNWISLLISNSYLVVLTRLSEHRSRSKLEIKIPNPAWNRTRVAEVEVRDSTIYATLAD